jgi:hypothetical protein
VKSGEVTRKASDHDSRSFQIWQNYPHAFFPHWTHKQLEKTGLKKDIEEYAQHVAGGALMLSSLNITNKGEILKQGKARSVPSPKGKEELDQFWAAHAEEEVRDFFVS